MLSIQTRDRHDRDAYFFCVSFLLSISTFVLICAKRHIYKIKLLPIHVGPSPESLGNITTLQISWINLIHTNVGKFSNNILKKF